uniref:Beta-lactamase-related domain-containing protein n=1 Tax=Plectus sambesii TaxID=2011161 RepID=A0A914UL92_9BILA
MGLARTAFLGLGLAFLFYQLASRFYTILPIHIGGQVEKQFELVEATFRKNFQDGWERDGASFVVYHKGKKVVDLWGGYADTASLRKWKEDTISVVFSSTKAVAALCVALLVDRGQLKYDDLVTKHWPEFGKHGKENVTVQWVMSHMAGLAYVDEAISEEDALDHKRLARIFEEQKPNWPPGTATGYHALTYGWLVDQLIRRADPQKRGIGQFFRENIAQPNNIDFHIGLPKEQQYRVARMTLPSIMDTISEMMTDIRVVKFVASMVKILSDTPLSRVNKNPSWLNHGGVNTYNNPDYHRMEQAAALGIGNARSLAQIFQLMLDGKIIKKETLSQFSKLFINQTDVVMGLTIAKGQGLFFEPLRRKHAEKTDLLCGHLGYGGQNVNFDLKNNLVLAYVNNGLKTGMGDLCRTYIRLRDAVYDVIEQESHSTN